MNDMGTWRKLDSMSKRKEERIIIENSKKEKEDMITNIRPAPDRICEICNKHHLKDGVFVTKMEDSDGETAYICLKCAIEATEIEEEKE